MVEFIEFKRKIEEILLQDYRINFLGKNIEKIVNQISDIRAKKIYSWIEEIIARKTIPIKATKTNIYKDWHLYELLTFRYAFNMDGTEYRILLVKIKNSFYIEFHLGDHKYYDKVRKNLFVKEEEL
ncbi:MAG: hypothetical protein KKF44_02255 [Nanoarchaeota archaeon]|nr:hypothetical protein [Nanoarchaeota archaeon]